MSTAGLASAAFLTSATQGSARGAAPTARPVDLFLNLGQSNAGGDNAAKLTAAYKQFLTPLPQVRFVSANSAALTWSTLKPTKIGFGEAAVHHLYTTRPAYSSGARTIALFKYSVGSTSTAQWKSTHMKAAVKHLNAAIAKLLADPTVSSVRVLDMVWIQGEQDVIDGDAYRYGSRFRGLHNMVRAGVPEAKKMHATVVHLNPTWSRYTSSPERKRETALFNKEVTTLGKGSIINDLWSPNPAHRGDGTHYSADSFARGGVALAKIWAKQHAL